MHDLGDDALYRRGTDTLLASWAEYARGAVDARVDHLLGVTAAVFASGPERDVYNNAVLAPALDHAARADAVEAMEAAYAAADVKRFAAWVEEGDTGMRQEPERRGYVLDTSTLAMDFAGDCGIYNVGTREPARRRGLGAALTAAQVRAARERGCRTASLQSTRMGEGVYRAVGFRALRRILEYTPRQPQPRDEGEW